MAIKTTGSVQLTSSNFHLQVVCHLMSDLTTVVTKDTVVLPSELP